MNTKQILNPEKKLAGRIVSIDEISDNQRRCMFKLLNKYFDNVREEMFFKDLNQKRWAILFEDRSTGELQGFSTQELIEENVDGIPIKALFSGDTIIDKEYWGSGELPRVWGKLVKSLMREYSQSKLLWFYISKGYMTYLLMPRYFYDYYPKFDSKSNGFERSVLDKLALKKFGSGYNQSTGIVKIDFNYYLKEGVGQITDDLLKNQDVNFFMDRNPNHTKGNELACIVELKLSNMKPMLKNLIECEE